MSRLLIAIFVSRDESRFNRVDEVAEFNVSSWHFFAAAFIFQSFRSEEKHKNTFTTLYLMLHRFESRGKFLCRKVCRFQSSKVTFPLLFYDRRYIYHVLNRVNKMNVDSMRRGISLNFLYERRSQVRMILIQFLLIK